MRQKLQSDIPSPILINFSENFLPIHVRLARSFLSFVRLELFVKLLALHLVHMIHDSNGKALSSISLASDQAVMESELQALPVQIPVLFLISYRRLNEVWKTADVEVLEAVV